MNRFITKGFVLVALVGAMTALTTTKADASFVAYICDAQACTGVQGTNWVLVDDNGAGDNAGAAGVISMVTGATIGGMTTTVNTSSTKPAIPQPQLDITFTAVGVGDVWLYATDTDYTSVSSLFGSLDGNFSGSGTIQGFLYGGDTNQQGTLSNGVSTPSTNSSPFHLTLTHPAATTSPYSLTAAVHIVRTSAGTTTGDFLIVPEPATMSLFGLGLAGVAALRRRRQAA
jgi:hypothetical protein